MHPHSRLSAVVTFAVLLLVLGPPPAHARDWFVREGSSGDGSQKSPFGDPWEALEKCEAGDHIHVARGKYYGRQESGTWKIPFANLELYGGYTADFKTRDPWENPTELTWKATSKNLPRGTARISGGDDYSGFRLDGFVIDLKEQNSYAGDSLQPIWRPTPLLMEQPRIVIANNVILNTSWDALRIRRGVTVENNLIVNSINSGIQVLDGTTLSNDDTTAPPVVRNNTIAFTWDYKTPGTGGQPGSAINVLGPATIEGNLLFHADNHGLYVAGVKPEKISVKDNTFFMNLFSNVKLANSAMGTVLADDDLESLDEVGFKTSSGNEVRDPKVRLDKAWMDKFSQRSGRQPGQVKMDEWNKYRQLLGLPLIATGGRAFEGLAPPWELKSALALLDAQGKAGAHRKALPVGPFNEGSVAVLPNRNYEKADLKRVATERGAWGGRAIEAVVAVGQPRGLMGQPEGVTPGGWEGTMLFDASGQENVWGYFKKGSSLARTIEQAKRLSSRGDPQQLFVLKGVAYDVKAVPLVGVVIDSLSEQLLSPATELPRPQGRDWFVRQGAKNGDGSKERPFKDPYLALERVEAGDTIHVAAGDYNGKLKGAQFKIDMPFITLLGGYDANFTERDPWKNPTLLRFIRDEKNDYGQGSNLEGALDHTGAIVDGFVFDRRDYNKYASDGDLLRDNSNRNEAVWLSSRGATVRNCVFLNGAGLALRISSASVVENNIFINFLYQVVRVERGDDNSPALVRNNTILFAWNDKFGDGSTTQGYGLKFDTGARGIADNNILHFVDNHAIEVFGSPSDVSVTNNAFSFNLFSNFQTSPANRFIDDATMSQFSQAGLRASEGNQVVNAQLPIDAKWFEVYSNRTGTVPGKVTMDDWNQLRSIYGLTLIATGGSGPSGFAPRYDYKKALELFPRNPKVKAGARRLELPVEFKGIVRSDPVVQTVDAEWPTLSQDPASLLGKRVAIKVAMRERDNQWADGLSKTELVPFKVSAPDGGSGLPKRVYVKKGTRHERVARSAQPLMPGQKPTEVYLVKGLVQARGELLADSIERLE